MVGIHIKRLRQRKGYSINELAEKAGVSKSYLSYIERGIQKNPSLQVLSRISETLDISVEELFSRKKEDESLDSMQMDQEWIDLIKEAIESGVTKEDFSYYLDFMKFKMKQESTED